VEIEDIVCPYCGKWNEVCNDDGHGMVEDHLYQDECIHCEKVYVFTSCIDISYSPYAAECLNGADHQYKKTTTIYNEFVLMRCINCEEVRQPTEKEWFDILPNHYIEWGL